MKKSRLKPGFTLVELMVTMVIIIVLASLAFVMMSRARKAADTAVALTRIRGLSQANAAYATDHAGKYVPLFAFDDKQRASVQWFYNKEFLEGLIGNTDFLDEPEEFEGKDGYPESVLDPVVVRAKKHFWSRISASFGYNAENMPGGGWGQANTARRHSTHSVKSPARTCQFITGTDWIAKYSGRYLWERSPVEGKTPDGKIAFRHNGKALVSFYDGHTEAITIEDMRRFDSRGGINNVFWGGTQN